MTNLTHTLGTPRHGATHGALIADALATVGMWMARTRQRRHLAELSEAGLRDIGVTPGDARVEISKPFWRA